MPANQPTSIGLAEVKKCWRMVLPFSLVFVIFGTPVTAKTPAMVGENEVRERRLAELVERSRDLLDEILEEFPNGPDV